MAVDGAAAHDGRLDLGLELPGVAGLHLGSLLVQGIVRVGILQKQCFVSPKACKGLQTIKPKEHP